MQNHQSAATSQILPFRYQLRWILIGIFVGLVVLPVAIIQLITLFQTGSHAQRQVLNQLESVADLKQNQIDRWLDDAQQALHLLMLDPMRSQMAAVVRTPAAEPGVLTSVNTFLKDAVTRDADSRPRFRVLVLYTPDGRVVAASDAAQIGRVVSRQPYFTKSLVGNHIQPPYYTVGTESLTMFVTRPLLDARNQTIGVLAGELNLDTLSAIMLERSGLGESGETLLVSLENNYLLTPSRFPDYPMTRAYHSEGIEQALQGRNGAGQFDDYREPPVPVLGVYRWIPNLQAALLAKIDVSEALAASTDTRNLSIALAALISILAVGFGMYTATRMTRPIVALTRVAEQISAGDLQQRVDVSERNEIGVLAHAFNSMTIQLQQTQAGLEQRVAERTADLERSLLDLQESTAARDELSAAIREMSSPVVPVLDGILVMPLVGLIDSGRAAMLMKALLSAVERHRASIVILDVTGVPLVDTQVARTLIDAANAVRLLGTQTMLVGLRPELAQTIVGLGVDLSALLTLADLQTAVTHALRRTTIQQRLA